jgi:enoyl-CoA hydratase/carnithine racemase
VDFETLLYEERDGVAIVTMNRPEVHNAFDEVMQRELKHVWRSLRTNRDVRVVILTGAGDKAFCSGLDRGGVIADYLEDPKGLRFSGRVTTPYMFNDPGENINPKQNDLWKPIIAAVNGIACAGALYMLGEADIIIAAEHATFFDPHVTFGMVCGFESTHLLQKLPLGEVLRVALLGSHERMSAARAHQVGLVSEVVPADQLMERAMWVANAIASAPVLAIQGTLRAVWMAHETTRKNALAQVSTLVSLGTDHSNLSAGEEVFKGARPEWRLR